MRSNSKIAGLTHSAVMAFRIMGALTLIVGIVVGSAPGRASASVNCWDSGTGICQMTNLGSFKCMDVYGNSPLNGTAIIQWTCNHQTNQKFRFTHIPQLPSDVYTIATGTSGYTKCLDVEGASLSDGARLIQWDCSGNSNQAWQVRYSGYNGYVLNAVNASGKCADVPNISQANGTGIVQWYCYGDAAHGNQRWQLTTP